MYACSARLKASVGIVATAALVLTLWAGSNDIHAGRRLQSVVQPAQVQESLPTCKTLMRLFKTVAASPQAALQRMSKTGKPTLEEWTNALQDWKWGLTRAQITGMFHGLDTKMDGQVDMQELLSCFRRGAYEGQFWQAAPAPAPASFQAFHPKYNCHDGLSTWKFGWSDAKKQACGLISASELRGSLHPGLTPAQVIQQIDQNRDGVISHEEWVAASTGRGNTPFVKTLIEPQADFAFNSIDRGQDGHLSGSEIMNSLDLMDTTSPLAGSFSGSGTVNAPALKQRVLARWSTLGNAFHKMDTDDNHRLSLDEFGAGLAELRPPVDDPSQVEHLFAGIDALHDGRITPPEWHGTMESGQLFQTPEALEKVLHSPAHGSNWIHSRPSHAKAGGVQDLPAASKLGKDHGSTGSMNLKDEVEKLVSKAEGEFRKKAAKWAGTMKNACLKMGLLNEGLISSGEFHAAIGAFEPILADHSKAAIFQQMDEDKNGLISRNECYLTQEKLQEQLSKVKSLRNLFCDADFNNDGELSSAEFAQLGHALDAKSAGPKYSALFDDELSQKGPLTLSSLEVLAGKGSSSQVLSKEDSSKYNGFPAIIHGKCVIGVKGEHVPPGLGQKVGEAFSSTLSKSLGLTVKAADAQEQQGTTSKEFDVLYTSRAQNGAAVMNQLHEEAVSIQAALEEGIASVVSPSASANAWCSNTLDFYGPQAGNLPKGQKIRQHFGQLEGQTAEKGTPHFAAQ
mmetsp:Transcript_15886/g.37536  ORF Transcript_15886/g.37536 Transcript_15886/m.37536 type:complete len:737 (-) Transcript_15886:135-2345(-)